MEKNRYWDNVLYPSFRASIRGEIYSIMSQDHADEECFNFARRAISAFKFPKKSTDYTVFYAIRQEDEIDDDILYEVFEENGDWYYSSDGSPVELESLNRIIPHAYFNNEIGYDELEVIIAWMKVYWCELQLSNADNFEDTYTDANIKGYSRANAVDKNIKLLETYRSYARQLETTYSRVTAARTPSLGDINNE